MRKLAIFVCALALAFATGGSMVVLAAPIKTTSKVTPKTPAKPVAKAPTKSAPKAVGTLYRGTVKELYPNDFMFALRIGPGKLPYAIKVLPTTQVVSISGEALAFERLSAGQRVSVRGKFIGRSVIQANRITVEG